MNSALQFWQWFRQQEAVLYDKPDDERLLAEIDSRLAMVHSDLGWELGPSGRKNMYFAVSPSLDERLLPVARDVVAKSYESDMWVFLVGRQRRPWSTILEIEWDESVGVETRTIGLENWRHVVLKNPDSGLYEIIFECSSCGMFSDDQKDQIAYIVAQGLLGELVVIEKVETIEVVERLDDRFRSKSKPASWLPYAFGMKPLEEDSGRVEAE